MAAASSLQVNPERLEPRTYTRRRDSDQSSSSALTEIASPHRLHRMNADTTRRHRVNCVRYDTGLARDGLWPGKVWGLSKLRRRARQRRRLGFDLRRRRGLTVRLESPTY